jgi:hypothetical protein
MEGSTSVKRRVGEKLLLPIVAAGTSAAAGYVAKKGPGFVEEKVWPLVREAVQNAGGVAEKLPKKLPDSARSAASSGGELAEDLTQKARDLTGFGDDEGDTSTHLSPDKLSERAEERARHRAKRRKATKSK